MRALARRAREGGSWHVRVSLARTAMWIMSLPRTAHDAKPGGFDPASIAPWIIEMNTAWGPLTRLGPIARMSETPPRWDLPPAPLGSDPPGVELTTRACATIRWKKALPSKSSGFSVWRHPPDKDSAWRVPGFFRARATITPRLHKTYQFHRKNKKRVAVREGPRARMRTRHLRRGDLQELYRRASQASSGSDQSSAHNRAPRVRLDDAAPLRSIAHDSADLRTEWTALIGE